MLQPRTLGVFALVGLLAGAAASADERRYDRDDYRDYDRGYSSWFAPQVRLGVDVIWGGFGYAPPRQPVVWYPAYYANDRHYDYDQGHGRGHGKHRHGRNRWDDHDD